jgi:hypothetical protein
MKYALLLLLAAAVATPALLDAQDPDRNRPSVVKSDRVLVQEDTLVSVRPAERTVYWDTVNTTDGRPTHLLSVPEGKRFVLTDMHTMRHHDYPDHHPDPRDRFWIEDESEGKRQIVLDAKMGELPFRADDLGKTEPDFQPQPLHWNSGIALGPGHQLWVNYDFHGEAKRAHIRSIHFSGYYEDEQPRP